MTAPSDDIVRLEKADGLRFVVLNRPETNNALSRPMREVLAATLERVARDPHARCLVLTGAGENFSTGLDIAELATLTGPEAAGLSRELAALQMRIASLPIPTVAAIRGACLGQGLELALACDMRVAEANARIGLPGVTVGLTPGGASLARLARLIGKAGAAGLALTGALVTAERAFMAGLIATVLPAADFEPAVQAFAGHLASLSPTAMAEIKALLGMIAPDGDDAITERGAEALARCFGEGEARDLLRLLFGGAGPDATFH